MIPECPTCRSTTLLELYAHGWHFCNGCGKMLQFTADGEYLRTSTVAKGEEVPRPQPKEK